MEERDEEEPVKRSMSKRMEVWFPQQIILKIYRAFSITMIGPFVMKELVRKV